MSGIGVSPMSSSPTDTNHRRDADTTFMVNAYDVAYAAGIAVAAPIWAARKKSRFKVLCALGQRMGHTPHRAGTNPAVLIHAVSLGEMNATRELVAQLKSKRPDLHTVITTTTATGYDRGRQLYGGQPGVTLTRYPLDFTHAINLLLDATRPSLIVLMEGEIWPNFLRQCHLRKIPVVLVNGRISEAALARYRWIKIITASMLAKISAICVQDQVYADRFKVLGAPPERLSITGTMKFDTAQIAGSVAGDEQLAAELGLIRDQAPLWVCGSTGPGEEILLLDAYKQLLKDFPALRFAIIPRKPERFDEVAELISQSGFPLLRRSSTNTTPILRYSQEPGASLGKPGSWEYLRTGVVVDRSTVPVILGDTMGELRKFYSLADAVFVGRSLVDLGSRQWGSDMIEPAALAKPVIIGPWTHNFAETVRRFKAAEAMVEATDTSALVETISRWLRNPAKAADVGQRARQVVQINQGATARHVEVILRHLPP